MGTAIKHPVPDRIKPSFVIFDIRALWRSALSVRVSGCQKLQTHRINPVWHGMLYTCTHMATVVVKGLNRSLDTCDRHHQPSYVFDRALLTSCWQLSSLAFSICTDHRPIATTGNSLDYSTVSTRKTWNSVCLGTGYCQCVGTYNSLITDHLIILNNNHTVIVCNAGLVTH